MSLVCFVLLLGQSTPRKKSFREISIEKRKAERADITRKWNLARATITIEEVELSPVTWFLTRPDGTSVFYGPDKKGINRFALANDSSRVQCGPNPSASAVARYRNQVRSATPCCPLRPHAFPEETPY